MRRKDAQCKCEEMSLSATRALPLTLGSLRNHDGDAKDNVE